MLECNWNAVQVFRLCRCERMAFSTMERARLIFTGIAAHEIEITCRALRIPFDQDLLARVRILDQATCEQLNS